MPYPQFDRSRLSLLALAEREHDLDLSVMVDPEKSVVSLAHPALPALAKAVAAAKEKGASVMLMLGAHVLRAGMAPLLIDLMEKGYITHLALNGAGCIHDYEFALIGQTTESVAKYISEGQFGLWTETGGINELAKTAAREGIGFGEAVGRAVQEGAFPHKAYSVLAAAYRLGVPATIHVSIGCDIIHEHPNCDGAALGQASYNDFLVYTQSVSNLENGVFINIGSAVTGPEVYLKALSMCRNVAKQEGRSIAHFTTAVFDMVPGDDLDENLAPDKSDYRYYFRPWKTILARTVADGGKSYYVQGRHEKTVPTLHRHILGE